MWVVFGLVVVVFFEAGVGGGVGGENKSSDFQEISHTVSYMA